MVARTKGKVERLAVGGTVEVGGRNETHIGETVGLFVVLFVAAGCLLLLGGR